MERSNHTRIHLSFDCPHPAPRFRDPITGAVFKSDCGDRRNCLAARNHFRRDFENRLAAMPLMPGRPLVLWTFTARTEAQDAQYRGVDQAIDRSDPNERDNWSILNRGVSQLQMVIQRKLHPRHRQSRPELVRGRPDSRLALVSVREVGEEGRAHLHTLSDIEYVDYAWITDQCLRNGLGHPNYRPIEHHGSVPIEIARYLSKFASDDRLWPYPKNVRLYSAARGRLPVSASLKRFKKIGWSNGNTPTEPISSTGIILVPD